MTQYLRCTIYVHLDTCSKWHRLKLGNFHFYPVKNKKKEILTEVELNGTKIKLYSFYESRVNQRLTNAK